MILAWETFCTAFKYDFLAAPFPTRFGYCCQKSLKFFSSMIFWLCFPTASGFKAVTTSLENDVSPLRIEEWWFNDGSWCASAPLRLPAPHHLASLTVRTRTIKILYFVPGFPCLLGTVPTRDNSPISIKQEIFRQTFGFVTLAYSANLDRLGQATPASSA